MAPTAIVLTPSLTDDSGFVKSATPQGVPPTPRAEVRDDGTIQTTYKGWPLYLYFEDQVPGDVLGHGLGGVWSVVAP